MPMVKAVVWTGRWTIAFDLSVRGPRDPRHGLRPKDRRVVPTTLLAAVVPEVDPGSSRGGGRGRRAPVILQ